MTPRFRINPKDIRKIFYFLLILSLVFSSYTKVRAKNYAKQELSYMRTQVSMSSTLRSSGRQDKSENIEQWIQTSLHSIRSNKQISEETLRQYLISKASPLADYAGRIANSDYAGTIIAICWEESNCRIDYGTNNFFGLMSGGKLIRFVSIEAGISAINDFLSKAENNGRRTVESFRSWYCTSKCSNWESTVIHTKEKVENLE